MKKLEKEINQIVEKLEEEKKEIIENIKEDIPMFPFTKEGGILAYLLSINAITYEQYSKMCKEYSKRNKYIKLYDMAPRTVGQTWGEGHILSTFPQFIKASKKNLKKLYPDFKGEFDLWLEGIHIEVKANRANAKAQKKGENIASRAYLHKEAKKASYKYHFQQLKPSCCDVFIWIGICRDEVIYWVLTSDEVRKTGKLSPQHRNKNTGVEGEEIFEGQVFMTEEELQPFLVKKSDLIKRVKQKGTISLL
ncbi:MAG: restriction endonuclease subunit M [Clostridia bacterium]|nr:restriction endonuclease subunit M [Clostridia bacterium]